MNCPAKNDDSLLKHPTWNQNPSYLAAELTTRQDLNGVANSREHRNADELAGGWFGDQNEILESDSPPGSGGKGGGAEEQLYWLSSIKTAVGNYGHPRLLVASHSPSLQRIWDWVVWLASVIFCSYLLSAFQNFRNPVATLASVEGEIAAATRVSSLHMRSTCPTGGVDSSKYNTPLHVGALFIILFVSTAACGFPLLATKFPGLKVPALFFFIVRHFGTGVLIATAFVHLLPTAFILLGNPCLSDFWIKDYPAIPGAIALAGVFFVIVIEMVFHPSRHITPQRSASPTQSGQPGGVLDPLSNAAGQESTESVQETRPDGQLSGVQAEADVEKDSDNFSFVLTAEQKLQKDVLQCILLEVGILFHSVFIGMALSVSVGNEFIVLLIAIAFHQTFEGLALGSRIAGIKWPGSTLKPWFMALAYGCTTPIGQAIGIGLSSLYSPDSEVGLILVGTMNAISAGLLVFASLVELLSEDFLSYESWRMLRGMRRVGGCLLVFFGAFSMSLVGAWA
ncbi:hypothetical protein AOL_s00110g226 [Orbilia oligospora ATCC 24927]|uniref:High-affinity Zn(2+) transporter zrt1 n=1 Tax=Arthrobotrys oligospora (strain ATCC 24927 / CBS 115.81 / DSM 1491) TaxID=756982 RepID=G1XL56_ARTOA|nr:hypothetical protein AOL_s00110g226 [Orbilia oligospora ATCC 24927]EGX46062.1 hypothetical protein AOL_s00110g226 [Orbilia oligospora ATCC 24927]